MSDQHEIIKGRSNPILKRARSVGRGRESGVVLVEGERLLRDALGAGIEPEVVLVEESCANALADLGAGIDVRVCGDGLLDGVGSLKTSPGVAGVIAEPQEADWGMVEGGATGPRFLVCVAGVADPGNLGALARVAEAAGALGLVVVPGGARPFGPKALRGSMGSLFRLPVFILESVEDALHRLSAAGYVHYVAATRGGESMHACAFSPLTALWVTAETGEAPEALSVARGVTIPMAGEVESLNVTVAGALLAFAVSGRIHGEPTS